MSDPNYHSIDADASIGGQVRRGGIGLMRPFAVVASIAGVGVVLYFLLAGGEAEPPIDTTPREEFRPVQTPRNEGFRTPSPPPLPTVEVPVAPPPPPHHRRRGCRPQLLSHRPRTSIAPGAKIPTTRNALSWSGRRSCWSASAPPPWSSTNPTRREVLRRRRPTLLAQVRLGRVARPVHQIPLLEMAAGLSMAIVPS